MPSNHFKQQLAKGQLGSAEEWDLFLTAEAEKFDFHKAAEKYGVPVAKLKKGTAAIRKLIEGVFP